MKQYKTILDDFPEDMKNYAKYILRDGTTIEKRELLTALKGSSILKDKLLIVVGLSENAR